MHAATAHDALIELAAAFTNAEIAEVLGIAPETVSRLRNEDRDPRGEVGRRLDAFQYVFRRALGRMGGDRRAVRWAIVHRQEALGGGTVARLLRDLEVERALAVLEGLPFVEADTAEDLRVSDAFDEALVAAEREPAFVAASAGGTTDPERFLADHPEIEGVLPELVDRVRSVLGDVEAVLSVASDEGCDNELVVQFRTPLPVEEASERMRRFYAEHWSEVAPYSGRISIAVE